MGCSALLFGQFAVSQESRFQASKRSNMGSAVLVGGRSSDIQEFCFQAAKCSYMNCAELQGGLFADCQEWHFQASNVQVRAVPSCKRVDLLMLMNSVFR